MAEGRVVVDEGRCKGCALCTTACPQNVLFMANDRLNARGYHPVQYRDLEGRCTGCALCAVICPDVCFTVYRQIATAPRGSKETNHPGRVPSFPSLASVPLP